MISDDQIRRARAVPIDDVIAHHGVVLKRVGREFVGPCPRCGGRDRFSVRPGTNLWHCRHCRPASIVGDTIGLVMFLEGRTFENTVELLAPATSLGRRPPVRAFRAPATPQPTIPRPPSDDNPNIVFAERVWAESIPLRGTLGERYLTEQRGLDPPDDLEHVLRWNGRIKAVVALMTEARTNAASGVHRIFVDGEARKIERKMLGRQGVVRLSPDEHVTYGLGICEGIEDGLAVLSAWAPIWAATSAGAIAKFPVLAGIECLTIFADADAAGIDAANVCAARWRAAGREAVLAPPKGASDDF